LRPARSLRLPTTPRFRRDDVTHTNLAASPLRVTATTGDPRDEQHRRGLLPEAVRPARAVFSSSFSSSWRGVFVLLWVVVML
jgi:hypothetical protein